MKRLLAIAAVVVASILGLSAVAAAHHTTVTCQSPGIWLVVNSEADKSMTFTTDQGHEGSIPAGDSTTVEFSGSELTVFGVWSNGQTATNSGEGDCSVPETTTTTAVEPTTTTTTELVTTTTLPAPTTTTTLEETTTTVTSSTTTEPNELPTTSLADPPTTTEQIPPDDSTSVPETTSSNSPETTSEPVSPDPPSTPPNGSLTLPETGASVIWYLIPAAAWLIGVGAVTLWFTGRGRLRRGNVNR